MSAISPKQVERDEEEGIMLISAFEWLVLMADEECMSIQRSCSLSPSLMQKTSTKGKGEMKNNVKWKQHQLVAYNSFEVFLITPKFVHNIHPFSVSLTIVYFSQTLCQQTNVKVTRSHEVLPDKPCHIFQALLIPCVSIQWLHMMKSYSCTAWVEKPLPVMGFPWSSWVVKAQRLAFFECTWCFL